MERLTLRCIDCIPPQKTLQDGNQLTDTTAVCNIIFGCLCLIAGIVERW